MANGDYGPPLMPTWLAYILIALVLLAFGVFFNYGADQGWWARKFVP